MIIFRLSITSSVQELDIAAVEARTREQRTPRLDLQDLNEDLLEIKDYWYIEESDVYARNPSLTVSLDYVHEGSSGPKKFEFKNESIPGSNPKVIFLG